MMPMSQRDKKQMLGLLFVLALLLASGIDVTFYFVLKIDQTNLGRLGVGDALYAVIGLNLILFIIYAITFYKVVQPNPVEAQDAN